MPTAQNSDPDYTYPDEDDAITADMIRSVSDYQIWNDQEQAVILQLMQRIIAVPPPRSLLDIGAGWGRVAFQIAPYFSTATLVEPDPSRRSELQTRNSALGLDKVGFAVSPALPIAHDARRFSVVMLSHVIQHIPIDSAQELMEQASEFVDIGGIFYIATTLAEGENDEYSLNFFDSDSHWNERAIGAEEFERFSGTLHEGELPVHFFLEDDLRRWVTGLGFSILDCTPFHSLPSNQSHDTIYRDIGITAIRVS